MGNTFSKPCPEGPRTTLESLRQNTSDFAHIWLRLCLASETVAPRTATEIEDGFFSDHWLFKKETGVEFYEVQAHELPPEYPRRLHRAVGTFMTCADSNFVLFQRVRKHLMDLPCVKNVEWIVVAPRPRIMLVGTETLDEMEEIIREHDCIGILASDGSSYVLDLSGWQFGYDDFIFEWEDYMRNYVYLKNGVKKRNPAVEYDEHPLRYAAYRERGDEIQKWKQEVDAASDETLHGFAKGMIRSL